MRVPKVGVWDEMRGVMGVSEMREGRGGSWLFRGPAYVSSQRNRKSTRMMS